ncbi:Y-family DNA polymerase [Asticcacaulis solisilvae]|uniref:Y-family DNA polymerase n=1 Tax=Asticcacaulis solisilvae TaxID=1217274 RepID=UPI003FD75CAC
MRRVVSLYLPRWSTDRLRRRPGCALPPEQPLVLKGMDGRKRVVTALDKAAADQGLYVGMPLAKAQALVEGLVVHDAEPEADAEALDTLARWALRRFSPVVAADAPNGLVIDITGAAHLNGGEDGVLDRLVEALKAEGVTARAAVADSWGAAHAAARFLPKRTAVMGPARDWLPALPLNALRLTRDVVSGLSLLGFDTIGDLVDQPRAPLIRRFGLDLARRLDQAFGHVPEPIDPIRLPDVTSIERHFAEPIGAPETIARYTGKLTETLCDALEGKSLGARQLDLVFYRTDNRIEAVRVAMARPVRDIKRLTRLLCDQIETVDPGFGIERMRLVATEAEPLIPTQTGSDDAAQTPDISVLVDILSNRIGADRIFCLQPMESDVPERSVARTDVLGAGAGLTWPAHWPRPLRLFRRPETVITLGRLPDYPPKAFIWRGIRHIVTHADGPERIFGEWWKREAETDALRDYFHVEVEDGRRFWLFRTGDGESDDPEQHKWYVHGVFS